jgi:hypothetical protein
VAVAKNTSIAVEEMLKIDDKVKLKGVDIYVGI